MSIKRLVVIGHVHYSSTYYSRLKKADDERMRADLDSMIDGSQ